MSPRQIVGVLCSSCQEHNDKTTEDILWEDPDCFNGVLDMSDGEDFHKQRPQHPFSSKRREFFSCAADERMA